MKEDALQVITRGVGKPDYTTEVALGQMRPGLSLKYSQAFKMFGYTPTDVAPPFFPWVLPLLAPGGTSSLYDVETGAPMPYLVLAGYTLTLFEKAWNVNQDSEIWLYFDGALIAGPGLSGGGGEVDISSIVNYSTALLDPLALSSHLVDVQVINRGLGDMRGGVTFLAILERIGSPPLPETKVCVCPFCKVLTTVKVGTTDITCSGCKKPYKVFDLSRFRKS